MTKININNHDEGKNTSPVEQEYFELLEKIKELREKKTGLNQHVIKIIEEEVQLVLGMFSNRLKALQYLNEKSLANKDYFRLLIELEEAEAKFEEVKKEYNKTHFETVIKKSGLSRVKHNYNDKQLLSLLIDSSVEEILSLIDTINEEELVLLEGGLTAKDINFNKKGNLNQEQLTGQRLSSFSINISSNLISVKDL
jgi:hypothetical protein